MFLWAWNWAETPYFIVKKLTEIKLHIYWGTTNKRQNVFWWWPNIEIIMWEQFLTVQMVRNVIALSGVRLWRANQNIWHGYKWVVPSLKRWYLRWLAALVGLLSSLRWPVNQQLPYGIREWMNDLYLFRWHFGPSVFSRWIYKMVGRWEKRF